MDPALVSSDIPAPSVSPEPSSTRPNPFDDTDATARKRRRTSASGSPSASVDTAPTLQPALTTEAADGTTAQVDSRMKLDKDPELPHTPERNPSSRTTPDEPPTSSRVTINLRNAPYTDATAPSKESSDVPNAQDCEAVRDAEPLKTSVEELEEEMPRDPGAGLGISRASPPASPSPPIEIITLPDDEEDVQDGSPQFGGPGFAVSIIGDPFEFIDPTPEFPYRDPDDTLQETVHRLAQYIATQSPLDTAVLDQVQDWLELYVKYAKHATPRAVLESLRANRSFWQSLTDVMMALTSRKPSLLKSAALRPITLHLYASFIELTAQLIATDCYIIHEWQVLSSGSDSQGPLLFSLGYLQQFHHLTRRHDLSLDTEVVDSTSAVWPRPDPVSLFVGQLIMLPEGSIESQGKLATSLIGIIPRIPRLTNQLASVTQVLSACLRECCRSLCIEPQNSLRYKQQLECGYGLWMAISTFLTDIIEKHVTFMNTDSASCLIQALTEMLKLSLQSDNKDANAVLQDHRLHHSEISAAHTAEAIAWEWKIGILDKLIRSSQMQLRVMAVTTMCNDLVGIWKRLCDAGEEHNVAFLNYLGQYLLQIKLIDYILGPNCHPEIIVESANIIGFLVVTKMYKPEHTDRLWQGITSSQDPRVADALTKMTATITNLFDYTGLLDLCEKFQSLPIEGFNIAMRMLWDNVLRELVARCQMDQVTLSFVPYNLCLRLLRESSMSSSGCQVASPEMQQASMQKFKELLAHGPDNQGRQELYLSCIQDIASKSATTLGSLWCLSMAIRPAVANELSLLIQQHDLVQLIVEELEHAVQLGQEVGMPAVLSGPSNQPRRDFISNIIQLQPGAISEYLGSRIWDILVGRGSACADDRRAGWNIIMSLSRRATHENSFLRTCFSQYLPNLPPLCFSEGMLDFVKEQVLWLVNETPDCALDEDAFVANSSIEHLWRILLGAEEDEIVNQAIRTLAVDVYLESRAITTYPFHRARTAHLSLVNRALQQLKNAARRIKASNDGTSSGEDEPMVIVSTEEEMQEQERIFARTLQLLQLFMEAHYSKPRFSAPDLRSLMGQEPSQVEGDLALLKYQSFDGSQQTDVKPLHIGKLNTAGSLLASLRRETGFDNYRVFYRGHQFVPTEEEICKSLEDLHVDEGLILVKRDQTGASTSTRVKPGSSPLEIELLSHFSELWGYLSMDDEISKEIYSLLVKLPVDGHMIDLFESETTSYKDIFLAGQPYKSLYAVHALVEYQETAQKAASDDWQGNNYRGFSPASYQDALRRSLSLTVKAISDQELLDRIDDRLQIRIMGSLMQTLFKLLQDSESPRNSPDSHLAVYPSADRLIAILADASLKSIEESSLALIHSTFSAILRLSLLHPEFWKDVVANTAFASLIRSLTLQSTESKVRELISEIIEDVVEAEDQFLSSPSSLPLAEFKEVYPMTKYFWSIFSSLVTEAIRLPNQCQEFFSTFKFLLSKVTNPIRAHIDLAKLAAQVSELLLSHNSIEMIDQIQPYDPVARGLISVLHLSMQLDETIVMSNLLPNDLAEELFWKHLFPQTRTQLDQPVAKVLLSLDSRSKVCEIIFRLVRHDSKKFRLLLKSLNSLVPYYSEDGDDPYLYELPCGFDRFKHARSPCGYVGLRNLSNTCYLNSLLTQLFMNVQFRRFVMKSTIADPADSQQLLFHTQKLFGYMQDSFRRFVDPALLVGAIKTYEDSTIDIHNQMDVDEFYNLLFDRLESQFPTSEDKKLLRSFYGGQLVQQVKSKECEHISERLEPFSAIQCDIKGKGTLQQSLQAYVDGEIMEGDNKYKCSTCDRHVDAVKRACLKDIPDHLIFHLKRFDFNLRTLQRSKINDYFSFPPKIDMRPYTIEHLRDPSSEQEEDIFELVGILVHSGTAESGHYYSYIRERPSSPGRPSWVEFNDDVVATWDPLSMESSTFGGADPRSMYDTNGLGYDKSYSAYMLFYQRSSSLKQEQRDMMIEGAQAPLQVESEPMLREHILNENTLIVRRHCLFDPSHTIFVQNCVTQAKFLDAAESSTSEHSQDTESIRSEGSQTHSLKDLAMELAISHFDQVVTRTKDSPNFDGFSTMIKNAVAECEYCAYSFFDYFNMRHAAFRELNQRNPDSGIRAFTGRTLIMSLVKIMAECPQLYYPSSSVNTPDSLQDDGGSRDSAIALPTKRVASNVSILESTILIFDYLWRFFHVNIRSWDEYFGTVLDFAKLGPREVAHLLAKDYLFRVLRIISSDLEMKKLPPNYTRMLNNVMKRNNSRPPSYLAVLALIDYLLQQLEPVLGPEYIVDASVERLNCPGPPFPWTSDEIHIVHSHPNHLSSSFFAEKLLAVDQAQMITRSILGRMIATGSQMDNRIFRTLQKNTQGETTTQPMDPYLRGAAKYIEVTQSTNDAQELIRHLAAQARNLQNAEGSAFLEFFNAALTVKRPDAQMASLVRNCSMNTIPEWAPHLLVYPESGVRYEAEQLLDDVLFQFVPGTPETDALTTEHKDEIGETAQRLGMNCLLYLREKHVNRRSQIGREAASTIIRIVSKCSSCFPDSIEANDERDVEFRALQSEVIGPLRRLIVDELEDDGSDWDGSCISSDPLDGHADMGIQPINDLEDTNLL